MRVASLGVARPAYYDRNSASSTLVYSNVVAPHADTLRGTYTTPSGKKAYVETATVYVRCETAPTSAGRNVAVVRITDASAQPIDIARVDKSAATVVNTMTSAISSTMPTIYAGETVTIRTFDLSTGGTVDYGLGVKVTQFDA